MKFNDITSRLTGISCPIFGISWNPPASERDLARRVIAFLEDRRVLYNPSEMEMPEHCVHSVIEIRHYITSELQKIDEDTEIAKKLRAMRAGCRKFLNTVQGDRGLDIIRYGFHRGHSSSWIFNAALGEMRGVFGVHLLQIAAEYGLDVEDDLAAILPVADDGKT
jgi:hypothetical protein